MDLNLNNKTALITGASKGIGKAIAQSMAKEGCNLIITARSEDKLSEVKTELQKKYNVSVDIFPIDDESKGNAPTKYLYPVIGGGSNKVYETSRKRRRRSSRIMLRR